MNFIKPLHGPFLALLALILTGFSLHAQDDAPEFGDFSADELSMKECSFDKSADAVILLDQGKAYFDDMHHLISERRIRLKILKEKGLERADIRIPYYSNNDFENLSAISAVAMTPLPGGSAIRTLLENKNIFFKKMNRLYSMATFAIPNVKVGSIIEYRYQSNSRSYAGLKRWAFQSDIPVVKSAYELMPLTNSEFAYTVYKLPEYPIKIKPDNNHGRIYFEMNNVPGLRDEIYAANTESFLQRVNFQFSGYTDYMGKQTYTSTWKELTRELLQESAFGSQANKDLSGADIIKSLPVTASATEKVKLLYAFVRSNISWNNFTSLYSVDGVKSALEKRKGNSGDINLLLTSLLKSAGIEAYPLLVSERDHGLIDTTYSFLDQFNKVAVYAVCDGNTFVLDGTDYVTPFFMVPTDLLNSIAYLVDFKKSRFIYLNNLKQRQREFNVVMGEVKADGTVEGEAQLRFSEYAKVQKESRLGQEKDRYREALLKRYPSVRLDSFSLEGLKNDSVALTERVQFHYPLKKAGNFYLLTPNIFSGFSENPFVTQYRFTDIDFGAKYAGTFTGSFTVPENMKNEPLPPNRKLISLDKSMSVLRYIQKDGDRISFRFTIDVEREKFAATEYEDVKAFFHDMIELLNEPILLTSN